MDSTTVDHAHRSSHPHRPSLSAIVRNLGVSLLIATIIPSALFALCATVFNIWTALVVALVWCYGSIAWQITRRRRASGLLVITLVGFTAKTLFAFASGSTYIYFLQPAVTDAVVASLFLTSLTTGRPLAARLAADFYPMDDDVAGRPRVQRLLRWLTAFWAGVFAVKAFLTVWLLQELSTVGFVAVKGAIATALVLTSAGITLAAAVRVARSEGLLHAPAAA